MNIELIEFATLVSQMRQAQENFNRMKYSPDFEARAMADDLRRDLQKRVDSETRLILAEDE